MGDPLYAPAAAILTNAVVIGVLVLVQILYPWKSWREWKHCPAWIQWPMLLLYGQFVALVVCAVLWYHPAVRWPYALRVLMEVTWLTGLGGQVYIILGFKRRSGDEGSIAICTLIAVTCQVTGFVLSFFPDCHTQARSLSLLGPFYFQANVALGFYRFYMEPFCAPQLGIHIDFKHGFVKIVAMWVILSLAALAVLACAMTLTDNTWFYLSLNFVECGVHAAIIITQVINSNLVGSSAGGSPPMSSQIWAPGDRGTHAGV